MRMFHLPSGKIINPAKIIRVALQSHFFNSQHFYVQLEMKAASPEVISEKLSRAEAKTLQNRYAKIVIDAYGDVSAYQLGFDEGELQGRSSGYNAGYQAGEVEGYRRGYEAKRQEVISYICHERERHEQMASAGDDRSPNQHEYLYRSVQLLTELIEKSKDY